MCRGRIGFWRDLGDCLSCQNGMGISVPFLQDLSPVPMRLARTALAVSPTQPNPLANSTLVLAVPLVLTDDVHR
jgi:hypothetical protein